MTRLTSFSSHRPMHELHQVGRDQLVLRSGMTSRVICFVLMAVGALLLQASWIGSVLIFGGVLGWFGPPQATFDREKQTLRLRRWFSVRSFPLPEIVAVEVSDGGLHLTSKGYGPSYRSYEVALSLDSSYAPRLYLTNHGDLPLTREMARQIAEFLRVPVRDEMARPRDEPDEERGHYRPTRRNKKKRKKQK